MVTSAPWLLPPPAAPVGPDAPALGPPRRRRAPAVVQFRSSAPPLPSAFCAADRCGSQRVFLTVRTSRPDAQGLRCDGQAALPGPGGLASRSSLHSRIRDIRIVRAARTNTDRSGEKVVGLKRRLQPHPPAKTVPPRPRPLRAALPRAGARSCRPPPSSQDEVERQAGRDDGGEDPRTSAHRAAERHGPEQRERRGGAASRVRAAGRAR